MAADLQARHASSHADENQWMDGAQGLFWGRYGAAGMLLQNQNDEILLQLRAAWCHHGGTWGIPGGALRNGESPEVGALREMGEEHGLPAERIDVFGTYTANFGYWSYVTVIGRLHAPWTPRLNSSEAD